MLPALAGILWCGSSSTIWGQDTASQVFLKVPFFPDRTDQCGPSTLAGILSYWGKAADPSTLRKEIYQDKLKGALPMDMVLAAEAHGLKTQMVRGDLAILRSELLAGRPVVAMLNTGFVAVPVDHYVIVTGFDEARQGLRVHSAGTENQFMSYKKFIRQWDKADNWAMLAQNP